MSDDIILAQLPENNKENKTFFSLITEEHTEEHLV